MSEIFDICVDYDTLCNLEYKIDLILHDLGESTERMTRSIQSSQGFLAGHQYEKAMQTTMDCVNMSRKTESNLRHAKEYLKKLEDSVMEYGQCVYKGEAS